jgi:hypothetical protein
MDPLTFYGAVGLVWLATFLVVRQRKGHRATLGRIARRLGLRHRGDAVSGELEGAPVIARVTGKTVEGDRVHLHAAANWPLPLDLGLELCSLAGARPERGFGACFRLRADEPDRARELLVAPLQKLLLAEIARGSSVTVRDQGIVVSQAVYPKDEIWLPQALSACARAMPVILRAAEALPPAAALRGTAGRWQELGLRHGLTLRTGSPLRLEGTFAGARVAASSVRVGPASYQVELRVALREPLGLGLLIQPAALYDRHAEPLADDVTLGDRTFDDELVVRGEDGAALRAIFDAELRERILAAQRRHGPLFFLDDALGVRLPALPEDPATLERTVTLLVDLAEHIQARRRGPERHLGPYR